MQIYKRLGKGFFYSILGHGGTYLIAFFLAPMYARAMNPEEYAVVGFANSLRNVLTMLMPMGVGGAVVFFYNQKYKDIKEQRKNIGGIAVLCFFYSLVWFLIYSAVGKIVIEKIFGSIGLPFYPYGFLIGLSAFLISFSTVPTALFIAKEKIALNTIIQSAFGLTQVCLIILFVVYFKKGAKGQIVAVFLGALLFLIVYYYFLIKDTTFSIDLKLFKNVSKFAIPLLPHTLFMWVLNLSDRMVISYYGKEYLKDLGFYSFGYAVGMVMQGVVGAFTSIWSPVFMSETGKSDDAKSVLGKAASYSIFFLSLCAGGLILFSKEAIVILSSGRYEESAKYVSPVVLGYLFQGLYSVPGMTFYRLKKTYFFPLITGVSAVTNITINFYGIPRWGVMTAAWATAAGFFVMAFLSFILGHFRYPLCYRLAPLILSAAMMAGAFFLAYSPKVGLAWKILMLLTAAIIGGFFWLKDRKEDEKF